jgi:hypothetical protein
MRITTSPVRLASSSLPAACLPAARLPAARLPSSRLASGALAALLVLGALAASARAEHKDAGKPRERVAAAAAAAVRTEAGATSLTTGELGLTGIRAARKAGFLAATEIAAEVRPYAPDIERCYLDRLDDVRHAGRLDLTFVIGRDGYVVSLDASAPGLPARTVRQMATCIREAVDPIHFPERRSDTTAVVPYYFQHTDAPGGGPQLSCWNPKGCR